MMTTTLMVMNDSCNNVNIFLLLSTLESSLLLVLRTTKVVSVLTDCTLYASFDLPSQSVRGHQQGFLQRLSG